MGRKVFISVLGTSWYNECTYVWKDGTERSKTNFIQLATLESIGAKGWTVNDAVYILVTQKSKEKNWHLDNDERMDDRFLILSSLIFSFTILSRLMRMMI